MPMLKLSSPWMKFYHEVTELFRYDKDITVVFDDDAVEIKIFVNNDDKADALSTVLPQKMTYGNITLTITIYPANTTVVRKRRTDNITVVERAFAGNEAVVAIKNSDLPFTNLITYVIFKKEVVQYFNDNLGDAHGLCSTLYEEIARDVLEPQDGVYYCTDNKTPSFIISLTNAGVKND